MKNQRSSKSGSSISLRTASHIGTTGSPMRASGTTLKKMKFRKEVCNFRSGDEEDVIPPNPIEQYT